MNLDMFKPGNETEPLSLSITKNCETLTDQAYKRSGETLEFKLKNQENVFHLIRLFK